MYLKKNGIYYKKDGKYHIGNAGDPCCCAKKYCYSYHLSPVIPSLKDIVNSGNFGVYQKITADVAGYPQNICSTLDNPPASNSNQFVHTDGKLYSGIYYGVGSEGCCCCTQWGNRCISPAYTMATFPSFDAWFIRDGVEYPHVTVPPITVPFIDSWQATFFYQMTQPGWSSDYTTGIRGQVNCSRSVGSPYWISCGCSFNVWAKYKDGDPYYGTANFGGVQLLGGLPSGGVASISKVTVNWGDLSETYRIKTSLEDGGATISVSDPTSCGSQSVPCTSCTEEDI